MKKAFNSGNSRLEQVWVSALELESRETRILPVLDEQFIKKQSQVLEIFNSYLGATATLCEQSRLLSLSRKVEYFGEINKKFTNLAFPVMSS